MIFILLSVLTVAGAVAAMALRNLIHCALALSLAFAGLAGLYLQLDAQFVGFAQLLIYVGAVAILVVFAILLTGGTESPRSKLASSSWVTGCGVALAVFGTLAGLILSSKAMARDAGIPHQVTVREIGDRLMAHYILPLEVLGLLLTVALIGAVIIAMREKPLIANSQKDAAVSATRPLHH